MKKIIVPLGARSYPIFIADDRFRSLGPILKKMELGKELFVVASPEAKRYYGKTLSSHLARTGIKVCFAALRVPRGQNSEKAKSEQYARRLIQELLRYERRGKRPLLAAFSGGVLGDLTGYVASIYKRGIPYLQLPTTLLAQVDSSIGGKVGIDLPEGKNLLGSFYQPRLVYADLSVLERLPRENLKDGLAEVVKYGVIANPDLFSFLEKNYRKILPASWQRSPDRKVLGHIVSVCVGIKADVVARDERDDRGIRVILNFGHTLGHAIEQAKGYQETHGKAISVGMMCAAEIAFRLGLCKKQTVTRLESLLLRLELPVTLKGISLRKLFQAESLDKKFVRGANRYVLPIRIGKVTTREGIHYSLIQQVVSKRVLA